MKFQKFLQATAVIGTSFWAMSLPLSAQAGVSSTLTLTNNYLWRGQTFSNRLPAMQGSLDYAHDSGFGGSVWMSNAVTAAGNDMETDLVATYAHPFGDVTLGAAASWYTYSIDSTSNATEYQVSAGYGPLKLEVNYQPKYFMFDTTSTYLKLGLKQPVTEKVALIGHVGSTSFGDETKTLGPDGVRSFKSYLDYRAGLSYTNEGFTYEGAYVDTNRKYSDDTRIKDGAMSVTVSKTF